MPVRKTPLMKIGEPDECWEWLGKRTKGGYPVFFAKGKEMYGHRVLYTLLVSGIHDKLTIDHLCRNTGCVNPAHMEVVSAVENVMRGDAPPAQNARKTHCKRGHPFEGDNLVIRRRGGKVLGRECRTCLRDGERRRRAAKRIEAAA